MAKNWVQWHRTYDDPNSSLSRRLEVVRRDLRRTLAVALGDKDGAQRLISLCAVVVGTGPGTVPGSGFGLGSDAFDSDDGLAKVGCPQVGTGSSPSVACPRWTRRLPAAMIVCMDVAVVRSNIRSVVGLAGVALALTAVVRLVPHDTHDPARAWQPPVGYVVADTVAVGGDRTLRLWTGPAAWYVESIAAGRHEGSVGASGGGDQFTLSEILGGFVGNVPVAGTRAVSVRPPGGVAVHASVHDGMFVVPAYVAGATEPALLVTPLDAAGRQLAAETSVPIDGRI